MNYDLFQELYSFVNDNFFAEDNVVPDMEMCIDYCEAQDIKVTDDVIDVISDLICNRTNEITP